MPGPPDFQALDRFITRDHLVTERPIEVDLAAEEIETALGGHPFLHHGIAGVLFQGVEEPWDGHAMLFGEPRQGWAPLERPMAPHLVAIPDVGWQGPAQRLEFPDRLVTIELRHIIAKRTFKLAIGLRMLGRGVDEPNAQVPTEGLQQFPAKRAALVKDDALGNHLPLAHGRTQGSNRGAWIDRVEE